MQRSGRTREALPKASNRSRQCTRRTHRWLPARTQAEVCPARSRGDCCAGARRLTPAIMPTLRQSTVSARPRPPVSAWGRAHAVCGSPRRAAATGRDTRRTIQRHAPRLSQLGADQDYLGRRLACGPARPELIGDPHASLTNAVSYHHISLVTPASSSDLRARQVTSRPLEEYLFLIADNRRAPSPALPLDRSP